MIIKVVFSDNVVIFCKEKFHVSEICCDIKDITKIEVIKTLRRGKNEIVVFRMYFKNNALGFDRMFKDDFDYLCSAIKK